MVGYVHGGSVRAEFAVSLLGVCMEGKTSIDAVIAVGSGPNISTARNMVARSFLEEHAAAWLLMCDTDMWFPADTADRLIAAADPLERPVVGALCFSQNTDNGGGEPYSTMYEPVERDGQLAFVRYRQWPEDTVVPVGATGAACLLVHRRALEAVRETTGDVAAPWFRESAVGGALIGEDLTFCLRLAKAGIPVHVHTGVRAGHMKTTMLI